ncbi:hypothetical protein B0H16DRAFT_1714162 [Mycena metata]|uniref:ABC transporter TMD0 domain-containing protein n=1 Tax=Mycena metata TaxID=1033252 RepID=A0AAD7JWF8_9AGAR|nr:hypothetical protein B0H16DRAFT_1714162 [Mycena metata]
MLCENRFPLPGSPSTCTLDTAIVPLPSIFLIIALGANHFLSRNNVAGARTPVAPPVKLHILYLVMVGCQIAMTILELVRLALEQFGVGLLPFNTIGLICAFVVLLRERKSGRTRRTLAILAVYWFFLTIFEAIKVARLHTLEELNPTTTKTSQYPSSDWFLDNAVMLALYFIFFCGETVNLVLMRRQRNMEGGYKMRSNV